MANTPAASEEVRPSDRFPTPLIIAVLPFKDQGIRADLLWVGQELMNMLTAELSRRRNVIVVQPERPDEEAREQAVQQGGRATDDGDIALARGLGATMLAIGSLTVVDEELRVTARLVGLERGAVLGTATAEGHISQASAVAADLVRRVVRMLPRPRTAPDPA